MKKILFAIALTVVLSLGASAQSDGFFRSTENEGSERTAAFGLPSQHGLETDQAAPLASGLLVLTALGAGYAVARRKRD